MFKRINKKLSGWMRAARGELKTPWQRFLGRLEFYFGDHAIFRMLYLNKHTVAPGVFRSAQPSPGHIRQFAKDGIKTVVNLRGERDCAGDTFEREACEAAGIALIDCPLRSRGLPKRELLHETIAMMRSLNKPALVHCKSGADRAGFWSALYLMVAEDQPVAVAKQQLSLRYGHVRQGKTGLLDHFFDAYEAHHAATGESLETWIDTVYEPWPLKLEFQSTWWGTVLTDWILRRE